LRHAQAVLKAAQVNLAATRRLHENGHASELELENARRDATTASTDCELVAAVSAKELIDAERGVALARGQRDLAIDEWQACAIRAPYAGRTARVLINEHEFVQRGTPLIEVVDDTVLLARFLLPSALFRSVGVGRKLELHINETATTVEATVSHVAAVLDAASVTVEVYAEVDNAGGKLRAGMNGTLQLASIREQ
jgi:multidrug resistance efflux pump